MHITRNNKSRAKFSDELYLRWRLKLFRNVSQRLFSVTTATAIDPDSRGDSNGGVRERIKIYRSFRIAVS